MLMDIIETVFDRPTISTFVLMTGDKDFTRISARLKLRLNKTVIVVGIPGTVSRILLAARISFYPLFRWDPYYDGASSSDQFVRTIGATVVKRQHGSYARYSLCEFTCSPVFIVQFTADGRSRSTILAISGLY